MKYLLIFFLFYIITDSAFCTANSSSLQCDSSGIETIDSTCQYYGLCVGASSGESAYKSIFQLVGISILIIFFAIYLYKRKPRPIIPIIATLLISLLVFASILPKVVQNRTLEVLEKIDSIKMANTQVAFVANNEKFYVPDETFIDSNPKQNLNDFEDVGDEFSSIEESQESVNEFEPLEEEFVDAGSEFDSLTVSDEFSPVDDEFSEGLITSAEAPVKVLDSKETPKLILGLSASETRFFYELIAMFLLLVVIGYAIRYVWFRNIRGYFLVSTVIFLGFIKGACPCMIMSFQNLVLLFLGLKIKWLALLWFLGLIPVTYFFGKVWCGWLCHLGALQELIFIPGKKLFWKSAKAQKILRIVRVGLLGLLIVQLIITKSNEYCHYDPFLVAFNLFSANSVGYVLLFALLLTSVLIYRPFCRGACPVGLILGWVGKIPGSKTIGQSLECVDCISCSKVCHQDALIYENKKVILNEQDCIYCGNCLGSCNKNALSIFSTITLRNQENTIKMKHPKKERNIYLFRKRR